MLVLWAIAQTMACWSQTPSNLITRGKRATVLVETRSKGVCGSAFCIALGGFLKVDGPEHPIKGFVVEFE